MRKSLPCLLLWFMMCGLLASSSAWAAEPVGNVESIVGTVQVEREGRTLPAKAGDPVYLLDKWQTRAQSSAEIVFVDNSRVKLAAATVLEITEYVYNPREQKRESLFSMLVGKARFLVQDLQGYKEKRFRVQTQTAIVGTRDTDFVVGVVPEPPVGGVCREPFVEAYCVENAIIMASRNRPDKPVILTSNMISQACGSELPTPPRFATAAERARMIRGVEKIGGKTEIGPARPKAAAAAKGEDKSGAAVGTGDTDGLGPRGGDGSGAGGVGPLGGSTTTTTLDTTTTTTTTTIYNPYTTATTVPPAGVG